MKMWKYSLIILITLIVGFSCTKENPTIPIYSQKIEVNGDSIYTQISDFQFIDQDSQYITKETLNGKIYITDFFFTSCPTICPRMKSQMKRLYDKFYDNSNIIFISHSIDPNYDTVPVLKEFSDKLEIQSSKWHLVTGDRKEIYDIAKEYMVSAAEDPKAPGGFIHSGAFILMDKKGRIRGYYDGTDELKVNKLIEDIGILLLENEN